MAVPLLVQALRLPQDVAHRPALRCRHVEAVLRPLREVLRVERHVVRLRERVEVHVVELEEVEHREPPRRAHRARGCDAKQRRPRWRQRRRGGAAHARALAVGREGGNADGTRASERAKPKKSPQNASTHHTLFIWYLGCEKERNWLAKDGPVLSALIQYSTGRVLVHGVGHRPWAPPPWVLPGCSLGADGQAEAELVVLVRVRVRGWLAWVGLGFGLLGCRVRF